MAAPPPEVDRPRRAGAPDGGYADFASFVHARQHALQRCAYLLVGDAHLAEDLVQEALAKTYARWSKVQQQDDPEAYVRRALTTTAISWSRRRSWRGERATGELPETPAGPPARVPDHLRDPGDALAETGRVVDALRRLPARQRAAVVLRYYEDLTEAQTADVLGCAVGTVKSQVSAALAKLRLDPGLVGPDAADPHHAGGTAGTARGTGPSDPTDIPGATR
ncbi:SigE family RNA polymerase sigma factor [Nocardioides sp. TRM66260-LWL]|uniref:SigE family RNA polymerase sigma factor n=1 Tax=Nocardioides sp. TRM66260-LWL TaxID=2874478 RepID=UPI001CC6C9E7|nr:SigE family RNA polymerase sigma factor [Nocardioides sp. TRM66260-LWL]MBZ5733736.1 SigE family RNA polymerase sigma factor [Nocardioides sp. TRM66260-LWL]